MLSLVWLVPVLPLVGVVVNGIFGRWTRGRAHILGVGTTGLSFLIAFGIFLQAAGGATLNWDVYPWIQVGALWCRVTGQPRAPSVTNGDRVGPPFCGVIGDASHGRPSLRWITRMVVWSRVNRTCSLVSIDIASRWPTR